MHRNALRSSLAAFAVLAAAAAPAATAASRPAGPVRYVLSVAPTFSVATLPPGVTVAKQLTSVHAVIVDAPAGVAASLFSLRGVVGVSRDTALHVTGDGSPSGGGVFGPAEVGGIAGDARSGAGVKVAVLDTGVADTGALSRDGGHLVSGPNFSGDDSARRDGFGHGTFMANLIAGGAVTGQSVGVAPAATVVDVKVAAGDGSTMLSKVLSGFDWVAKNASTINVLSLSLSATRPQDAFGRDPLTEGADAVRNAGVVVVVSAGNDPSTIGDPAQDPFLMAVGAADTLGDQATTASFSGRGVVDHLLRPDVVAPGVSILSLLPADSLIATQHPSAAAGNGLYRGSGTSQATAITAGAVAAFLGRHAGLTPDDVRVSFAFAALPLEGTADGAGLIRIPRRVRLATDPPPGGKDGQDGNAAQGNQGDGGQGSGGSAGAPAPSASSWSSSSWSSSSWSSSSWSASSWSASSWSASSWSSSSWSSSSWSSSSWSSSSWSSSSWSASSWSSSSWSSSSWSSVDW